MQLHRRAGRPRAGPAQQPQPALWRAAHRRPLAHRPPRVHAGRREWSFGACTTPPDDLADFQAIGTLVWRLWESGRREAAIEALGDAEQDQVGYSQYPMAWIPTCRS